MNKLIFVYLSPLSLSLALAAAPNSVAKKAKKPTAPPNKFSVKGKTFKLKSISLINVKTDDKITAPEKPVLGEHQKFKLPTLLAVPSQPSPQLPKLSEMAKLTPLQRYTLKSLWQGQKDVRLTPEWNLPNTPAADPSVVSAAIVSDGEFKILESLLLLKSKDTTPLSAGIAYPLLKQAETKDAAHEILGRGMSQLNIRTASQEHFKELLKSDKDTVRAKRGLQFALNNVRTTDYEDASFFSPYVLKLNLEDKDLKNLPLTVARLALEKKDLQVAWNSLTRVPADSEQAGEARFMTAQIYYRTNDIDSAKKELETLLQQLQTNQIKAQNAKNLKSLTAATLGQIYFQKGMYKEALDAYRSVDQEHPLWLETLVESAWSQILLKDYEGAAGNMFSLHTNYFQGAYKPESYIVRTVGYLQLCQFGDAKSVLQSFLAKYRYAQKQLENYSKQNPNHLEIVRDFLKAGTPKTFAGLPRSLLVEIARDPKFIELQKKMNEIEEDAANLEKLPSMLNELDQKFHQAQLKYTQLLQELEGHLKASNNATKRDSLLAQKKDFERNINKNILLRKIVLEAKTGLVSEVAYFNPIWTDKKNKLKGFQNNILQISYQNLAKDLEHWLDQSELLFYEIHNGAGEHLRYQMASNSNANSRTPASEKLKQIKKEDKDQLWSFDGEIWEDEVGHYRSSLKNVCPENEAQTSKGGSIANTNEGN